MKNLREVLERLLGRVHTQLKQRYETSIGPVRPGGKQQRTRNERVAAEVARLQRESRYEAVVSLYQQGTSIVRIADDLHMSRTTVRKFVATGAFPERSETLRSKSILDPYVPFLRQRLQEGPINASQMWRELQEQGFSGGYKVVARWLQEQGWQLRKGRFSQARKREENNKEFTTVPELSPQGQELPAQTPYVRGCWFATLFMRKNQRAEQEARKSFMPRTWQTDEVIRCLNDADQDEIQELVEEAGNEAAETLQEWIREGNGPKSLYDAIMRFTTNPNHSFDAVDWDAVVAWIVQHRKIEL